CPLGVFVGVLAGYAGRRTDDVLMRVTEIQLAIPAILLAIAVVAVLGPGIRNVILTLSVTGWTLYARLTRGETLGVKARDFVQAARATGAGDLRIMTHHVLPNVLSPVIVVAVFAVANIIVLEATLSFLGLGVEPNVVTWGRMLNGGRLYLSTAWWLTAFPGLAIFVTVLAVNLLGDHLRDWLDPPLRQTLGAAGTEAGRRLGQQPTRGQRGALMAIQETAELRSDVHSIEPIPEADKDSTGIQQMWIWAGANIAPINWALGALGIVLKLGLAETIAVIVIGNIVGCAIFAAFTVMGHKTGVNQMVLSR